MKKQVLENPKKNQKYFNSLVVIVALLVACYLTSNLMAVKLVNFFGTTWFDAGTIIFPLAYMLGDVLTEVWGFKTARKVIFLTFICNVFLILFTMLGIVLPVPDYQQDVQEAYKMIFLVTPRILIASFVGFLAGELSNSFFLAKIKKWTKGKHLWLRTIGSSVVGHFLDTVLFVIIAFSFVTPVKDLIIMILVQYGVKLAIEAICATPLAYGVINFIKRKEKIDEEIIN